MLCQDCCLHVSHQSRHLVFSFFLWSDSTQSASGPVARAFITESSCFWSKPPLHMQQDLSTQFRIHPVLREMWRDSHCRGLKLQFVTLLMQDRNMNSDFWLLKNSFYVQKIHFCHFQKDPHLEHLKHTVSLKSFPQISKGEKWDLSWLFHH